MNRQQKKNIRLIGMLTITFAFTMIYGLWNTGTKGGLQVDKSLFSLENTLNINKITINSARESGTLEYKGGRWILNDRYPADPSKIHIFFAMVQHVRIRRPVAKELEPMISNHLDTAGLKIKLYENEQEVLSYEVWGDNNQSVTYFRDPGNNNIYQMELPGYRTYVYALIGSEIDAWRNSLVFSQMKWRNLAEIHISYPMSPEDNFKIVPDQGMFGIEGLQETDTTRLFDYIDHISLLRADKFIYTSLPTEMKTDLKIELFDVGKNKTSLEIFSQNEPSGPAVGRLDSTDVMAFRREIIDGLYKTIDYFKK
ncbi:MAG: DUF4340 domain-containing protein [Cyclobacteriaceae bacterium]|nr:DUF4340 domain-containing protein [Cyclobacteriaceae bacterium]